MAAARARKTVWQGLIAEARAIYVSACNNTALWLGIDRSIAADLLHAQWTIAYPLFRAKFNHLPVFLDELADHLADSIAEHNQSDISLEARSALEDVRLNGTANQKEGLIYAALAWGFSQAVEAAAHAKSPVTAPLLLAGAASHMGTACGYFWAATRAADVARSKAQKKADKGAEKKATIESNLPEIIDQNILNAGYKTASKIADELRQRGLISLDRKELRKMVAAVKRSRASRPPAN